MDKISFITLISTALALFGIVAVHRLTQHRSKNERYASACTVFRKAVLSSVANVPPAKNHWGNEILEEIPSILKSLDSAISEFKPYLSTKEKASLDKEWFYSKNYIEKEIPKALSSAEIMYGGGTIMAAKSKEEFHNKINQLLNTANET